MAPRSFPEKFLLILLKLRSLVENIDNWVKALDSGSVHAYGSIEQAAPGSTHGSRVFQR